MNREDTPFVVGIVSGFLLFTMMLGLVAYRMSIDHVERMAGICEEAAK